MERLQQQRGGEEQPEGAALALPPEAGGVDHAESWDERVIREGIDAAVSEGRAIDNRTARYIAGQLHRIRWKLEHVVSHDLHRASSNG